jgi:hypothetical protein
LPSAGQRKFPPAEGTNIKKLLKQDNEEFYFKIEGQNEDADRFLTTHDINGNVRTN